MAAPKKNNEENEDSVPVELQVGEFVVSASNVAEVAEVPDVVAVPAKEIVVLAIDGPHDAFDLSTLDLGIVTKEGTPYTRDEADRVLTLAYKYRVRLVELKK